MIDSTRCELQLEAIRRSMRALGFDEQLESCLARLSGWNGAPDDAARCILYPLDNLDIETGFLFRIETPDQEGQFRFRALGRLIYKPAASEKWIIQLPSAP